MATSVSGTSDYEVVLRTALERLVGACAAPIISIDADADDIRTLQRALDAARDALSRKGMKLC